MARPSSPIKPPPPPSLAEASWFWFKLGLISFGGPAGQIAIMHQELVERRRWISEQRFLHALNYCMLLPGPEAQQLAAYLGWLLHKTAGAVIAGSLFFLPALLMLIALAWLYLAYGDLPVVNGLLYGVKPAVTAIVVFAGYRIATRALKHPGLWIMAVASFIAIFAFDTPFPLIVLSAAVIGGLGARLWPSVFSPGGGRSNNPGVSFGPALIDDDSPIPEHARFRRAGLLWLTVSGLVLWVGPMTALYLGYGGQGSLTQIAWFFTKAALLTFGGAYAVLPYVYQGAVEHYHWLSTAQMIDALALGETTPGPLIMVNTFVGFVAGWEQALLGDGRLAEAGIAAALVSTYFTFLPGFLLILAGGPLVETTRGNLKFTAPLTGITAAVVGVIVNLAVFFGVHVFWPHGLDRSLDGFAAGVFAIALAALIRFRTGVIPVIVFAALSGWLWQTFG